MTRTPAIWPLSFLVLLSLFPLTETSYAAGRERQISADCQPTYGHYWQSRKWGWYGARRPVRTPYEAKEIIQQVFIRDKTIRGVRIKERAHFFVGELVNNRGMIVDLILIDKRTGRIRSMY